MIAAFELERYGLSLLFAWADAPAKSLDERSVIMSFLILVYNACDLFDESPVRLKTSLICFELIIIDFSFLLFLEKDKILSLLSTSKFSYLPQLQEANNAKKAKLYSRIGKEVVSA